MWLLWITDMFFVPSRVCFQTLEFPTDAKSSLEEFLSSWSYEDERYYANSDVEAVSIELDKYLEVVDLYVLTLLASTLKDTDLAISWVNKAMVPMEKRQVNSTVMYCDVIFMPVCRSSLDNVVSISFSYRPACDALEGSAYGLTRSKMGRIYFNFLKEYLYVEICSLGVRKLF